MKFSITSAILDHRSAHLFLDRSLPFLLTGGNLPELANVCDVTARIYTTSETCSAISSHPLFMKAASIAQFSVLTVDGLQKDIPQATGDEISLIIRELAYREAERDNALVINIAPGLVLSDGALLSIKRLADRQRVSVFASAPLLSAEKFTLIGAPFFADVEQGKGMDPRQLAALAFKCLHEGTNDMIVGPGGCVRKNSGSLYWKFGETALLARDANLYPLMTAPALFELDERANRTKSPFFPSAPGSGGYVVTDSDELAAFRLADDGNPSEEGGKRGYGLLKIAEYTKACMSMNQRKNFSKRIAIHSSDLPHGWERLVKESDGFVGRLFSTVSILDRLLWPKNSAEGSRGKRAVIFGCGSGGMTALSLVRECGMKAVAVVDNNELNWGGVMDGVPVYCPDDLAKMKFDLIVVASIPGKSDIYHQLSEMGYRYAMDYIHFLDEMYVDNLAIRIRTPLKGIPVSNN